MRRPRKSLLGGGGGTLLFLLVTASIIAGLGQVEAARKVNCRFKCYRWERCLQQLNKGEVRPGQQGNTGIIILTKCDMGKCDCQKYLADEAAKEEAKKSGSSSSSSSRPSSSRTRTALNRNRNRFTPSVRSRTPTASTTKEQEKEREPIVRRPLRQPLRSRPSTISRPLKVSKPIVSKPDEQRVKFTDDKGRVRVGIITGTSVSSSVSTSSTSDPPSPTRPSLLSLRAKNADNADNVDNVDRVAQPSEAVKVFNSAELLRQRLRLFQRARFY